MREVSLTTGLFLSLITSIGTYTYRCITSSVSHHQYHIISITSVSHPLARTHTAVCGVCVCVCVCVRVCVHTNVRIHVRVMNTHTHTHTHTYIHTHIHTHQQIIDHTNQYVYRGRESRRGRHRERETQRGSQTRDHPTIQSTSSSKRSHFCLLL